MSLKVGGKLPSGARLDRIKKSPQYKSIGFENISLTPMKPDDVSYMTMMGKMLKRPSTTKPSQPIPFVKTNLKALPDEATSIVWFGHSSYLLKTKGETILVDPVFSGSAAPLSWMVKAFPGSNEYKVSDFPAIDYLILSHDHYDHLDFKTILEFKSKVGAVYCSLGVGSHLNYWGYDDKKIHDLDWWESEKMDDVLTITAAPARHFSGRGLKRAQTLWSSFIIDNGSERLYLGGDSGYDEHFKEIGKRFGPFDLAILECGQYNTMWPLIHMMPEQTVQAAIDLQAKKLLPVHWGKFVLAMHPWNEPIQRALAASVGKDLKVLTPRIGELVELDREFVSSDWWAEQARR